MDVCVEGFVSLGGAVMWTHKVSDVNVEELDSGVAA